MNNGRVFVVKIFFTLLCALIFTPSFLFASEKFIVAIDVGHSIKNFGALSARGVGEYKFNQTMAKALSKKIQAEKGIDTFIINLDGSEISLKERTKIANQKRADLFLSLHHDSVQEKYLRLWEYEQKKNHYSDEFHGYSIFVSQKSRQSKKSILFAKILGYKLRSHGFTPTLHHTEKIKGENRELLDERLGIYRFDDLIVLKTATMPAILLECGVIVNRREELLLNSEKFKKEFTDQIIEAILEYRDKQFVMR